MKRLEKRAEFLAVARGARSARRGFVLQAAGGGDAAAEPRCGFTVTKKIGNAVVRNRVRRRMREAVRLHGDLHARAGTDYVLVGREEALRLPFEAMVKDLAGALRQVHERLDGPRDGGRTGPKGRGQGRPDQRRLGSASEGPTAGGDTSTGRTE